MTPDPQQTLFSPDAGAQLSPRLAWIRKHGLITVHHNPPHCAGEANWFCGDADWWPGLTGVDWLVEHDSHGQLIALIKDYYDFTRDERFLRQLWPVVKRSVSFIQRLREKDRQIADLTARMERIERVLSANAAK